MAPRREPCLTYVEFVETLFHGKFGNDAYEAYNSYMNNRLAVLGTRLFESFHAIKGGNQMALSPVYLDFLAQHGLQDGNGSRALFFRHLQEATPLPPTGIAPRIPSTNQDFENLARHAQWAQEQEWIRQRPWMKAVFDAQHTEPDPSPKGVMVFIDAMELRLLGIKGGAL